MGDTEEKINTESGEAEIQEEEIEKKETLELKEEGEEEEKTENMETPKPRRKPATKKKPVIVEIPVDKAETSQPASSQPASSQPASSSTDPVPKARGRPKGSLGAKKREPPPEPAEPAQQVSPPEITLADVLRHTRMMQEARRNQTREKYKSWVV